jgi:peptidoglycan/LPS O-acetylase OafA/YrhL
MPQFYSLTGLRGWLALYIFMLHYNYCSDVYKPFTQIGRIGVTVFFVLSGTVLTLAQNNNCKFETNECLKIYMGKRIARIFPMYYLSLIFSFPDILPYVTSGININLLSIVLQLFGISTWLPIYYLFWNGPSWSVQTEIFFYLLFPYIYTKIKLNFENDMKKLLYLGASLIFFNFILTFMFLFFQDSCPGPQSVRVYIMPYSTISVFILGMITTFISKQLQQEQYYISSIINNPYILDFYSLGLVLFLTLAGYSPCISNYFGYGIFGFPACILILMLMHQEGNNTKSILLKILKVDICIKAGEISYTFYLFHYVWPGLAIYMGYNVPPVDSNNVSMYKEPILMLPYLIFNIGFSVIVHYYIEEYIYKKCYLKLKNTYKCNCNTEVNSKTEPLMEKI